MPLKIAQLAVVSKTASACLTENTIDGAQIEAMIAARLNGLSGNARGAVSLLAADAENPSTQQEADRQEAKDDGNVAMYLFITIIKL